MGVVTPSPSGALAVATAVRRAVAVVPPEALAAARLHLLDAIGVGMLAGVHGPVSGVTALAENESGGPCTVLGSGSSTTAAVAALVNGTLIHSLEFDDTHVPSVVHGSSVIAPASLAAAEATGSDGEALLCAFAVGWELLIRLGLASPGRIQARGFQITSAAGAFAAAAVSGLLHGDRVEVLANAIGIAGSQAGGTFAFLEGGDTVKAAQPAWSAHAGLLAADLARAGVTGPESVFEGRYGFYALYAGDPDAAAALAGHLVDLGTRWHLPQAAYKLVPCCHYIHPFVEGLSTVLEEEGADDIVGIHCWVPDGTVPVIADPWTARQDPATAHDARWSLPYVLGLVLRDGRVTASAFEGDTEPDVVALAHRVTYEPWAGSGFPERFPARLRVELADGRAREIIVADVKGGRERPIQAADVIDKALANLRDAGLADGQAAALVHELVERESPRLAHLSRLLKGRGDA